MLGGLFCLVGIGAGTGNIDHAQQAEDQRLDEAGEQVKIAAQDSGDAEGQDGNAGQKTGGLQQTEESQNQGDDAKDQCDGFFVLSPQNYKPCAHSQQNHGYDPAGSGNGVEDQSGNHGESN